MITVGNQLFFVPLSSRTWQLRSDRSQNKISYISKLHSTPFGFANVKFLLSTDNFTMPNLITSLTSDRVPKVLRFNSKEVPFSRTTGIESTNWESRGTSVHILAKSNVWINWGDSSIYKWIPIALPTSLDLHLLLVAVQIKKFNPNWNKTYHLSLKI